MDGRLLNTAKREIFDIIRENELDPFAFEWTEIKSEDDKVSKLRLKTDPTLYFTFDVGSDGRWWPRCSPFGGQREANLGQSSWSSLLAYFLQWLSEAEREMTTPDPWKALAGVAQMADLNISPDTTNTQFTFGETQQISKSLNDIRSVLAEHVSDSAEQIALINRELDSLLESSQRMGRKDWFNLAIGTLINIATAVALSPDATKQVFQILKASLTGIVHFLPRILASGQALGG